jgi:hypothetical protein
MPDEKEIARYLSRGGLSPSQGVDACLADASSHFIGKLPRSARQTRVAELSRAMAAAPCLAPDASGTATAAFRRAVLDLLDAAGLCVLDAEPPLDMHVPASFCAYVGRLDERLPAFHAVEPRDRYRYDTTGLPALEALFYRLHPDLAGFTAQVRMLHRMLVCLCRRACGRRPRAWVEQVNLLRDRCQLAIVKCAVTCAS